MSLVLVAAPDPTMARPSDDNEGILSSMTITLETRVRRADDAAWRIIDGQAAIVSADTQRMRVLNEVGSRIWELCDGRSLAEIVTALGSEFDAGPQKIETDAIAFASDLVKRGMLQVVAP